VTIRVLVTGGAGFIGHHLVRSLLADDAQVLVVDNFSFGRRSHLEMEEINEAGRLWLHEADLRQPDTFDLLASFRPEIVYHLGAIHFIPYCDAHPQETLDTNVLATDLLLRRLRDLDVRALVFASTAAVYGFAEHPLTEEGDPPRPGDIYGLSKWLAEELVRRFADDRPDVRTVAARLFNVFGPGETNRHLLPDLLDALRQSREVALGNTWPRRDYTYVTDVVRALRLLADGSAGYDVLNVSTGTGSTVLDVVRTIEAVSGHLITVRQDPARVRARDGHLVSSNHRILARTGWRPAYDLKRGLDELLEQEG
jgi:UDP-glucose 4-epimerase